MKAIIATLPGDGIGPEITAEAVRALSAVASVFGHNFIFEEADIGGIAIDKTGKALPSATSALCKQSHAVLLGAVGGPQWGPSSKVRPEQGLLGLRKELGLFANLRPVRNFPSLLNHTVFRPEVVEGVDLLVVRELTGGIYFGEKRREATWAMDACTYSEAEVERVVRRAAVLAMSRRKKLTSVDKANVLETSRLWREVAERVVSKEFPELEFEHLLVDACAMHLIRRPTDFDVIVTENMFGDILTDEASMLSGSIGLLPSASLGEGKLGLYEPIHGSAPDIAGKGIANPYGTLSSAAMLLRYSLGLEREAMALEEAISQSIQKGALTADLTKASPLSTSEVGRSVEAWLLTSASSQV